MLARALKETVKMARFPGHYREYSLANEIGSGRELGDEDGRW